MKFPRRFAGRIRALFRRRTLDREMAEELQSHLELEAEQLRAEGLAPAAARHAAEKRFGHVEGIKEQCRDQRSWAWIEHLRQDLRIGLRSLTKYPLFSAVTILTLGLGIGANTAIFTVINAALLRPLPVSHPEELVTFERTTGSETTDLSYPVYRHLREHNHAVRDLAASYTNLRHLRVNGSTADISVRIGEVSGNFFGLLGLTPAAGRLLVPRDNRDGAAEAVVVLSDAFWRRQFGGDPAVVGRTIALDHLPCVVVGVAPAGFRGLSASYPLDLWCPIELGPRLDTLPPAARLMHEAMNNTVVIGRLPPDITRAQATAEIDTLYRTRQDAMIAASYQTWPKQQREHLFGGKIEVRPGHSGNSLYFIMALRPLVSVLWIVVGLVLLLACANVASLLFVRGSARRKELGLRSALGASRARLVGQLLVEALLLAALGGLLGLALAHSGARLLASQAQADAALDFSLDPRVLGFVTLVSLLSGLAVGLAPALRFSRPDLLTILKDESGSTPGSSRLWFNRLLTIAQVAISLCLLAGAGLFVRTLQNLYAVDAGFERRNTVVFLLRPEHGAGKARTTALYRDVLARLQGLPEVQSATLSMGGMGRGTARFMIRVDGYTPAPGEDVSAFFTLAGPRYFETLGTPVLRGREYAESAPATGASSPGTEVVVNETLVRKFFPTVDPLGRTFKLMGKKLVIVGVARDAKYASLRDESAPQVYLPLFQSPMFLDSSYSSMSYQFRTANEAGVLASQVRELVRQIDPTAEVTDLATMSEVVDQTLLLERTIAKTAGAFSLLALLLTGLGLYGVLAFNVAQRTRELGVRLALGAEPWDLLRLVIRQGMILVVIGGLLGLAATPALTRLVQSRLYGVSAFDPLTFGTAFALLLLLALVACWLPARRATKVDPMVALRSE